MNNKNTDTAPPIVDSSWYRRVVIRPMAKKMAPVFCKMGFSANGVGWLKLILGLAGAGLMASVSPALCLLGALGMQLNFLLDAADGDVARMRGEANKLSGEYLDKLCDHLPKTAMYFCWGYGAYRLTGADLALFCGFFFAAWNIYPRFCGVETLLERLDKAPKVLDRPEFHKAVAGSFVTGKTRGKADYWLTVIVHPAVNAVTMCFLLETIFPGAELFGTVPLRLVLLYGYTAAGVANFVRKGVRFFGMLEF